MSENQASSSSPPTLDGTAAGRWLQQRTVASSWLHEEIGRRMHDRLQWIRLQPQAWLDWLPLCGGLNAHQQVHLSYPTAQRWIVETTDWRAQTVLAHLKPAWHQRWRAGKSIQVLPSSASALLDMVWANMSLHTAPQPMNWLRRWQEGLRVDGFVMFSCLGPDTLQELVPGFQAQGWAAPTHALTDMHDWGDMLVEAGFAEPVMDMEKITLTYATATDLWRDLRATGRNLHIHRFGHLRGKGWLRQFEQIFEALKVQQGSDRVHLTVEVIYGHAIKPLPRARVSDSTTVSLAQMRDILGREKPKK